MTDAASQFHDAIRAAGLEPPCFIEPGKIYRFPGVGKRNGNTAGWCILFSDCQGGVFGDWSSDLSETWQTNRDTPFSPSERAAFERQVKQSKVKAEADRKNKQEKSARKAYSIWNTASPAPIDHPYLVRKGIKPHGARLHNHSLVMRVTTLTGGLTSLQFVDPDGTKRLLAGGRKKGCVIQVAGDIEVADRVIICEGWATGCTLAESYPESLVLAAIDVGNLESVALAAREQWHSVQIIIAGDDDRQTAGNPGAIKARRAAIAAHALLALPQWPDSSPENLTDFNDLAAWETSHGGGRGNLLRSAAPPSDDSLATGELNPVLPPADISANSSNGSAATRLVELAEQQYTFGVSTTGETYALPKSGPPLVAMLRGSKKSLRGQLAKAFFRENRRTASQQALADALAVIEGIAQESDERELYVRVASHDGDLWIDMGDQVGRAIRITSAGWSIETQLPILFRRTALNGALPDPQQGYSLDELWNLLNVATPDRPLVAAWLVAALFDHMPHPVLSLLGEQGTGKTTAHKMLVTAIDPGSVPVRKPPRDQDGWVLAAAGSWVVGIDNMSDVSHWLSDSFCRAVTGDGDVRRKLYTDGDLVVFSYRRCICLNGIDLGATRGDLAERMLPITLDQIPDTKRLTEDEIWPRWNESHPRILGAILDLTARVLNVLPTIKLSSKPRMADFAMILAAVDKILGTDGLDHYVNKQSALAADSLTGDCFIVQVLGTLSGTFKGTSTDLLQKVAPEKLPYGWPKSPRAATTRLKRLAPAMRKMGWSVENDGGQNKGKILIWTIAEPEIARDLSPPNLPTRQTVDKGRLAGIAGQEYGPSQDDCCARCDGEGCAWCAWEDRMAVSL